MLILHIPIWYYLKTSYGFWPISIVLYVDCVDINDWRLHFHLCTSFSNKYKTLFWYFDLDSLWLTCTGGPDICASVWTALYVETPVFFLCSYFSCGRCKLRLIPPCSAISITHHLITMRIKTLRFAGQQSSSKRQCINWTARCWFFWSIPHKGKFVYPFLNCINVSCINLMTVNLSATLASSKISVQCFLKIL